MFTTEIHSRVRPIAIAMTIGLALGCGADEVSVALTSSTDEVGHIEEVEQVDIDQLRALGYVSFSEDEVRPGEETVSGRDDILNTPASFLYNNRMPPSAHLIDQTGRVLHSWSRPDDRHWSGVEMLPNGDLLVPSTRRSPDGSAKLQRSLIRMDWDGRVLWNRSIESHHDVEETPSGELAVLTYRVRRIPDVHRDVDVRDVSIVTLAQDGQPLQEKSLYSMLAANPDVFRFQEVAVGNAKDGKPEIDLLHANSVEFIGETPHSQKHFLYTPGNVLVSIRHQDTIAIFDPSTEEVVWAWGQGEISGPHDASLLPNGHILFFDNGLDRDWSRVIELEPVARKIVWEYRATPPESLYTRSRGSSQRMPNGNTLVAESDDGKAYIVTPEGEVVWRFLNPNADAKSRRGTIVRIKLYPTEWIEGLLGEDRARG